MICIVMIVIRMTNDGVCPIQIVTQDADMAVYIYDSGIVLRKVRILFAQRCENSYFAQDDYGIVPAQNRNRDKVRIPIIVHAFVISFFMAVNHTFAKLFRI